MKALQALQNVQTLQNLKVIKVVLKKDKVVVEGLIMPEIFLKSENVI